MLVGILPLKGVLELHRWFCRTLGCGRLRLRGGAETAGGRRSRVLKRRGAHHGCIVCVQVRRGGHHMLVGPHTESVLTGACENFWLDVRLDLWLDLG